jgi:hypothetical protein
MALVASVPLTDEDWQPIPEGKVIALKHGLVRAHTQMGSDLFNNPNVGIAQPPAEPIADC